MKRSPLPFAVLALALSLVACRHRDDAAPPSAYGPPGIAAAAPLPPPAARGWVCQSDGEPQCPFARCIAGACGGCLSDADCKMNNACVATFAGLACVPRFGLPPSGPTAMPTPGLAPAPGPVPTPNLGGDPYGAARLKCLEVTNAYRARVGAAPLVLRTDKSACSDADAAGDARNHTKHGYAGQCGQMTQNECWGKEYGPWADGAERCAGYFFKEGPGDRRQGHGHYINMVDPVAVGLACGFYQNEEGVLWFVQNFFPSQ